MNRSTAFVIVGFAVVLAGCSGSSYVPSNFLSGPTTYTVGGTVSGLAGNGLTLANEGARAATMARAANSNYPNLLGMNVAGTAYDITILTQPSYPSQTCVIANGTGVIGSANVTNVSLTCTTNKSRFVYVANGASNNISAYALDASNGALTPISGSPFPAGNQPSSIAVDPAGRFAFVANRADGTVSAFIIDGTTGALTVVSGSPFATGAAPTAAAVDPSGQFLYVAGSTPGIVSVYALLIRMPSRARRSARERTSESIPPLAAE